jgi:hypothetical protein
MGTKDGSNGMETADCDREADIIPWDGRWSCAEVEVYQRRMAKRKPEKALVSS